MSDLAATARATMEACRKLTLELLERNKEIARLRALLIESAAKAEAKLIARDEEIARLKNFMGEMIRADGTDARRLRAAIVQARDYLARGRPLWNGPCHQCDNVLAQALSVENDADAIARAALERKP